MPDGIICPYPLGNYRGYYGYRNKGLEDSRLLLLPLELLKGKRILDVGCNDGNLTVSVAALFEPKFIQGIDVDPILVDCANRVVRERASMLLGFPKSCIANLGSLPISKDGSLAIFPHNVAFRCGDFVAEPIYDILLGFSVTKWIHLDGGDSALRLFFKKCFASLRRGGKLILEPQPWSSYISPKKSTYTGRMRKNLEAIELFPKDFPEYLVKHIGFQSVSYLGTCSNDGSNFQRPLYLFTK
ncbi:MAG: hypothetical protein SGCHY_001024 [Lobulomycetales sp.]